MITQLGYNTTLTFPISAHNNITQNKSHTSHSSDINLTYLHNLVKFIRITVNKLQVHFAGLAVAASLSGECS